MSDLKQENKELPEPEQLQAKRFRKFNFKTHQLFSNNFVFILPDNYSTMPLATCQNTFILTQTEIDNYCMDPSKINLASYSIHNQCANECKFSFLQPASCPGPKPSQADECQVSSSSEHDMESLECDNDSDDSYHRQTVSALANYRIDNNGRLVLEPLNDEQDPTVTETGERTVYELASYDNDDDLPALRRRNYRSAKS